MLKIREKYKYAVVSPTSMGVRMTPENRQPVQTSCNYFMQATSAETNVLNIPSALGMNTLALTAFVKGSPIAAFIKNQLSARHISWLGPEIDQGGPWGYRHQFNIADTGFGARGPVVANDRAGEVGRILEASFYDLEEIFAHEGAAVLHISGLIAALSPKTSALCEELARCAKQHGTAVCFDMNYRASFWAGREAELRKTFESLADTADILVGADLAAYDYDLKRLESGPTGETVEARMEFFEQLLDRIKLRCPNASVSVMSYREVINANRHVFGSIMDMNGARYTAWPREIEVLDRIGGGDAFLGGLIYALLKGYPAEKCLSLAWAAGALAVTEIYDYANPTGEEQLMSIWSGNAKVRR